jgi:hypothetical protein
MKTLFKKLFSGTLLSVLFLNFNAQAQTWNIPSTTGGGTSTSYIGTTTASDINIGTAGVNRIKIMGTGSWPGTLKLMGFNTYFNFGGVGTGASNNNGIINWPSGGTNTDDNSTFTDRMFINGSGFVGIGTTSPVGNLVVRSASAPLIRVESPTASLHMAIATFASSYSNSSVTNDAVLYNQGENLLIQNEQPGKSIKFITVQSGSTFGSNQYVKMELSHDGKLGIGFPGGTPCMPASALLGVNGGIYAKSVKVELLNASNCFPDYVFAKDYKLTSLDELEKFITINQHLPEIPTAKEVEANGINLAEMDVKLLQKIEELTLYMIEMKKGNEILAKENQELKKRVGKLENK